VYSVEAFRHVTVYWRESMEIVLTLLLSSWVVTPSSGSKKLDGKSNEFTLFQQII